MLNKYCTFCLVFISNLKIINATIIPLRPSVPSTSTYKPSTLLLPPGFDSQKPPREPMLYPYAVSTAGVPARPHLRVVSGTTPDWIPVALNANSDLPLLRKSHTTAQTPSVHLLEDRISNDESKYVSPAYKEGPVFESIVYGTWKPDPPLQPVKTLNGTTQQQQIYAKKSNGISGVHLVGDGKVYNKTINRQHGGFIRNIQHKPTKTDREIFLTTPLSSIAKHFKDLPEMSSEPKLQRKIKKQGRRKIRPVTSTTEPNSLQKKLNSEETTTAITTTQQTLQLNRNVIKVNSTDPKLMEVVKQINESLEIKYNHKQTSTHSIDAMTTADTYNNSDDDGGVEDGVGDSGKSGISNEFLSTEPQMQYEDYTEDEFENINATRRSWPIDFMEEPFTTTDFNSPSMNNSDEYKSNESWEADPSEIPLAFSALNIPPSLWPKLPGNITKLGRPYEAESSAEEMALCVPITVQERNMINLNELVFIERVFCFPMPPSTTTSENTVGSLENIFTSSTTLKTVTTAKVQNFNEFIDPNSRVSKANIFKTRIYLVACILFIYFKFIF